jgi:hypothetical protein
MSLDIFVLKLSFIPRNFATLRGSAAVDDIYVLSNLQLRSGDCIAVPLSLLSCIGGRFFTCHFGGQLGNETGIIHGCF